MTEIPKELEIEGELTEINPSDGGSESNLGENAGGLFRIERDREKEFDNEVIFVRFLTGGKYDWEALLETDTRQLEIEFYDDDTPNQWNIQLIWAYEDDSEPDQEIRRELESETKFAIRRCVPRESLEQFLRPLEHSRKKVSEVNAEFGRDALIQRVTGNSLGFLFDQDTSLDEKTHQLLKIDIDKKDDIYTPSTRSADDHPPAVDTVELGDFRQGASKRQLDLAQFTLLSGRNGTGKTSLLDGITMGLVGQTRRDDDRLDSYDDLNVTLEGQEKPLPKKSKLVNNRIADWFGFRPEGPARRHVEFYRVNYHEAGETTRLLESPNELKIERVFRNFLYGEDLAYATKEKDRLLDRIDEKIDSQQNNVEDRQEEREKLKQRRKEIKKSLSTLGSARRDLSSAASALIDINDSFEKGESTNEAEREDGDPPTDQITLWRDWKRRFDWLEMALEASISDLNWETADDLRLELEEEVNFLRNRNKRIKDLQKLENKRSQIVKVENYLASESLAGIQFPIFFTGILFAANGTTREDVRKFVQGIEETNLEIKEIESIQSVESLYTTVETELRKRREDLKKTRSRLAELGDLEERRQELREQIRADTKEYLEITDDEDIDHCPACYIKQSAEEIRTREEPKYTHEDGGVPESIKDSLENIAQALDIIQASDPSAIDEEIRWREDNLCNHNTVLELFRLVADESKEIINNEVNSKMVDAVYSLAKNQRTYDHPAGKVISDIKQTSEADIVDQTEQIRDFNHTIGSTININFSEDRLSSVQKGLDVLENHWPEELINKSPKISSDLRTFEHAVKEAADATIAKPVSELTDEINSKTENIDSSKERIEALEEARGHLKETFSGVENSLDEVLSEYTEIVTTLFKVFQRPYDFRRVELTEDKKGLQVIRRENGKKAGIDEMSSGQRTALVLAIFVTNNLAHDSAPPVMLLDEPFAHLDELNTLSFFNLIIELAVQGDRQIVFATANDNLSQLLERKVGQTEAFKRFDLDKSHPK